MKSWFVAFWLPYKAIWDGWCVACVNLLPFRRSFEAPPKTSTFIGNFTHGTKLRRKDCAFLHFVQCFVAATAQEVDTVRRLCLRLKSSRDRPFTNKFFNARNVCVSVWFRARPVIVEHSFVAFEKVYMYWYLHSFETIHSIVIYSEPDRRQTPPTTTMVKKTRVAKARRECKTEWTNSFC